MTLVHVMVAGHLCIDFHPTFDRSPGLVEGALYAVGALQARTGGCVHTTGLALSGRGIDVSLAAAVGRDPLAGLLLDLLAAEGLDTSQFVEVPSSTSYSIVIQPPGRDRTFWHHSGANDLFDGRDLELDGVDLLHVGYPNLLRALCADDGDPLVALFRRARAVGCATSVDLAVTDVSAPDRAARWERFLTAVLPHTDVISPSVDDLNSALDWGLAADASGLAEAGERLLDWGAAVALVTAGPDGLFVATGDAARLAETGRLAPLLGGHDRVREPVACAPVTTIAGTTGAGDVATAGFLAGLLQGMGPVAAAHQATADAARHVCGGSL